MSSYRDPRDGTWRYRKRVMLPNGRQVRISGTPPTDTKVAAEAAERAHIDRVLYPERYAARAAADAVSERKKEVPTVEKFAVRFEAEYLPRSKHTERRSKKYILSGSIVPYFGALQLDEIDQGHVNGYIGSMQHLSTKTINNRLTVLSTMLRYAHELRLILEPTIKCHIKSMSPEIIAVPMGDVRKLIAKADDVMSVAVLLAAEAGLRIGEILGLQWTDIRNGQLTVRRAIDPDGNIGSPKHDKRRSVPLSAGLRDALEALPRRGLWVLANADGEPLGYYLVRERLLALYTGASVEIPKSETGQTMPWHSLRHTFGTECAARGVPLPVIKELMGHSSITTTMRYVTITGPQLVDAISVAFGADGQQVANRSAKPG